MKKPFFDLHDMPESTRIRMIAEAAQHGIVLFYVDDDAKADRYIAQLGNRVRVIDKRPGPVAGVVGVRVGPKES